MSALLRKRFGDRVKELRLASGLSQEAFADRCGFARSYMSRVERGGANPSLDAIEVLATALSADVVDLFMAPSSKEAGDVPVVPFAADGTCFNPSLKRPRVRTYAVGEKSATVYFEAFDDALDYLRNMQPARWWRPNVKGQWGLVTAVRWGPLPQSLA